MSNSPRAIVWCLLRMKPNRLESFHAKIKLPLFVYPVHEHLRHATPERFFRMLGWVENVGFRDSRALRVTRPQLRHYPRSIPDR